MWDDFVKNIRRGFDQLNPFDGGRNWNTLDQELGKKKKEEEQNPAPNFQVQRNSTPAITVATPAQPKTPNFNFNQGKVETPNNFANKTTQPQQRSFGAELPPELKVKTQQEILAEKLQERSKYVNKDGTMIDQRPYPARVQNDEFSRANEALKAGVGMKDVGNYWGSDAENLRKELMKPNPNKAIVQGLTQSINNRKGEITKMNEQMSRDEADEYAKKAMEARGGTFKSDQNKVGDFLGGVVAAPFGIVTKPAGEVAYMTNQATFDNVLEDMDRRYRSGQITHARLQQEFRDLTGGMITAKHRGKEVKVREDGIDYMTGGEAVANFAGQVIQQGVDSYVGGGTGVKAALTGGKEGVKVGMKELMKESVKQGLKESAVTGTLQTGADVLKGDGITPEALLLNYGVDAVLNTGGEMTGRAVKQFATNEKVKEATEQMNRALRENGTLDTISEAEVRKLMEDEIADQINTATRQVNEKRAAEAAQATPQASPVINDQTPNFTPEVATDAPTKPRSTQSIADLLPGLIGRDPNATVKQFDPADFGVEKSTYDRLSRQYGEQAAQNILNSSKDATNIRSMDAFVTSEAKKRYGAPKSNQQVQAEINARQAKAEEFNMAQGTPTPDEVVAVNGQMVNTRTGEIVDDAPMPTVAQLSKNATNSLENDTTGMKPNGVERSGGFVENGTARPVEVRTLEDGSQVIVDGRHTLEYARQNGIDDYPIVDVTDQYRQANVDTIPDADTRLGSMVDDFYQSKQGNQSIKFRDIEQLGKQVAAEAERAFKAVNSDFPTVARKIQEAYESGARTLDEVDLTPQEKTLWSNVESELDYVRRRASVGRKEISTNDRGELYFPRQEPGKYELRENLLAGFRQDKPGNEMKRKAIGEGGLELDEIDYSPDVIGNYITRYADTKLLNEERIARAVEKSNPGVDEKKIVEATKQIIDLQDRVNSLKTKITMGGTGKKVTVSKGKPIDFADELSKVGKTLDKEQIDINGEGKGFTNGERINSVFVGDKPLGDVVGLNQYRDAGSFAGTQVNEAAGDREVLLGSVYERLTTQYNLPAEDIDRMMTSIERVKADVPDTVLRARVAATYSQAAKQQLMETLQGVNIKNPKLRKDVSDLANQIMREGSIEQELSAKIVQNTLRGTNALFRKLNVSSALNELSDLTSFSSVFGRDMAVGMSKPNYSLIKTYNLGEIDPAIEPYIRQVAEGADVKSVMGALKKANDATRFYKFVEHYKTASFLTAAERHYTRTGKLSGDQMTAKILDDYRKMALPQDAFTKTFLNDYPLYTQYMSWGARNIQKEYRLATGKIDAGSLTEMSQAQRVARNAYANLPAKTVFWLASNGLKGTTLMTAFGLTDFTGLTQQDYSGIQEDDKSFFDETTRFTNQSTILSLINTTVQAYEKEQLKEKYKDADYNPYEHANFGDTFVNTYSPQFLKNFLGAKDLAEKGYSENAAGRVQYEAPDDPWNAFKSYVFGKNQTANAREYSGRENLVDRVAEGIDPIKAVSDMAKEQLGLQDTDYNRPLTDTYSESFKAADKEMRSSLLDGGRKYNRILDDLKKNSPDDYNRYIGALDGNHVNPEYWKSIAGDKNELSVFKMIGDRKKQLQKDLGTAYDPVYDLPDDQARSVLRLKASPTGDDIAVRNQLNKEQWYKDYKARVAEFYDGKTEQTDSDFKQTQRVKDWNALDDQLNSFYLDKSSKEVPEWAATYPLVYQSKMMEYGSPESKAFYRANGDAYRAQKDQFDKAQLDVINAMREIEGYPPMSWDQYKQATNFADTDGDSKKSGYGSGSGGGSGGGGVSVKTVSFGRSGGSDYSPTISAKVKKTPRKARVRKGVSKGKIVVKREKTL